MASESEKISSQTSLKKRLKLKCMVQNLNPVQDQFLSAYGVSQVQADHSKPMVVSHCSQPNKNLPIYMYEVFDIGI
jgi:hypothetical protein